jgi:hypothetical protein
VSARVWAAARRHGIGRTESPDHRRVQRPAATPAAEQLTLL